MCNISSLLLLLLLIYIIFNFSSLTFHFFFQLKYTIIQPAVTGSLHQLSQVFSKYGYEPKNGEKIITSETNVRVTGSNNRIIYSRPMYGSDTNNKVRFSYIYFCFLAYFILFRFVLLILSYLLWSILFSNFIFSSDLFIYPFFFILYFLFSIIYCTFFIFLVGYGFFFRK